MKKRRKYIVYISLHHTISFIQKKKKLSKIVCTEEKMRSP